jgi:hypothetical protein
MTSTAAAHGLRQAPMYKELRRSVGCLHESHAQLKGCSFSISVADEEVKSTQASAHAG